MKVTCLDTSVAPALQAAQVDLERAKLTTSLEKLVADRPEKDTLIDQNIMKGNPLNETRF